MSSHRNRIGAALLLLTGVSACGGPRLAPVMRNGDIVPDASEAVVERARAEGEGERARLADQRATAGSAAVATCAPPVCEAVARGELTVGMTEGQVLAATRTTIDAWEVRPGGGVTLMTPRPDLTGAPGDAVSEIAYIALQNGAVANYTYREPQGFRTVSAPGDATLDGRAAATADALLAEGDAFAAAGRLDLALDRYDRADVLRAEDPETTLRIATTLDKQLRPIEAALRYRLFLHQLELERIEARGEAAARLAEAIALAQQRLIVLDRR